MNCLLTFAVAVIVIVCLREVNSDTTSTSIDRNITNSTGATTSTTKPVETAASVDQNITTSTDATTSATKPAETTITSIDPTTTTATDTTTITESPSTSSTISTTSLTTTTDASLTTAPATTPTTQSSSFEGVEIVVGVSLVLVSLVIIGIIAYTAKYERPGQKLQDKEALNQDTGVSEHNDRHDPETTVPKIVVSSSM